MGQLTDHCARVALAFAFGYLLTFRRALGLAVASAFVGGDRVFGRDVGVAASKTNATVEEAVEHLHERHDPDPANDHRHKP